MTAPPPLPVSALHQRMGIELLETSPDRVVGRMPVDGNTQVSGLLHGGASCVLAEGLASYGAMLHGQPDRIAMGIEINATHHRAATAGFVTAVAVALHLGRRSACYEVVVTDDGGRRTCTARVTCLLIER